jgi:hypothetical protein
MGDDAIEEFVEDAEGKYKELGVRVTEYQKIDPKSFEYCGHTFGREQPVKLVRWEKALAEHFNKGMNLQTKFESKIGLEYEMRNMPDELAIYHGLAEHLGWFEEADTCLEAGEAN